MGWGGRSGGGKKEEVVVFFSSYINRCCECETPELFKGKDFSLVSGKRLSEERNEQLQAKTKKVRKILTHYRF